MAESTERKDVIAYYKKVNKLRERTLSCDFAKDKMITGMGKPIPYLSAGKIRQQFAPLFAEVGLEFEPSFTEYKELPAVGSKSMQHWAVTLNVRFIDIDTGYGGPVMSYIGEGTDTLDKGLRKAMTFAYKSWLSDFFCIEEGIDPEASGAGEGNNFFKSPEEQVEIKTKLAAQAIKPAVPAPKPAKPAPAPAKEEKPAESPAKAPAEPAEPAKPAKTSAKPAEKPAESGIPEPGCDAGFSPTGALAKTLKDRYANWQEFAGKGLVAKEVFEKMASDYRKISDMPSAIAFNTKYPLQK